MMARIEIEPAEFDKLMKEENRFKIVQELKSMVLHMLHWTFWDTDVEV